MRPPPNGFWLPVCIAKVIGISDHRVISMQRLVFEGLEPCEVKVSRRALRGLGVSNGPRLPGELFSCTSKTEVISIYMESPVFGFSLLLRDLILNTIQDFVIFLFNLTLPNRIVYKNCY